VATCGTELAGRLSEKGNSNSRSSSSSSRRGADLGVQMKRVGDVDLVGNWNFDDGQKNGWMDGWF
jgi:hypothetical protein